MIDQNLPADQAKSLASMLERKHGGHLNARYFEVETRREDKVIYLKVTLRNTKGTFVYPVEARLSIEEQELTPTKAHDLLLDYVDAYFEEFLSNGEDTYLPIDWSDFDFDGFDLQMRGQIINEHLEKLADELIKGTETELH